MNEKNALVVFQDKKIRRTLYGDEWWFVIEDVVAALTDSKDPKGYIKDMRRRDQLLSEGWGQIATPLRFKPQADCKAQTAQILKGYFASFNQYLLQRPNRLNYG